MRFHILTIFPKIFNSYLGESLFRRAKEKGIIGVEVVNIRDFSSGPHRRVDDRPFGGGPGMVFQIAPIAKAVNAVKKKLRGKKMLTILFSTRGKPLDAKLAKRLSRYDNLILICGRYEGVDERVAEYIADQEISIGNYTLSGGELPTLVCMEAVSRFLPGFLGKRESLEEIKGSYPVYTRPEVFKSQTGRHLRVPKALLSGNHALIKKWRAAKARHSR